MDPNPGATTYDKLINRFHEDNDMYEKILNQLNLSVFATSSNDSCTYLQAMQQTDKDKFIGAMLVEVAAHEEGGHWKMVLQSSLPVGEKKSDPFSFRRESVSPMVH